MMKYNPNCDGAGPHADTDVRLYPTGGGGNMILCRRCWGRENQFNVRRGWGGANALPESWARAKVYNTGGEHD